MAKQAGSSTLRGQIGGIVFYKLGDTYMAKAKGSLDKKRVMKDPAFEGSRRASAAFTHATKSAGLLRRAMGPRAMQVGETRMTGKLGGRMMQIVKTDTLHRMDERKVYQGDIRLLKGFNWNSKNPLGGVLRAAYTISIDRATGVLGVSVAEFVGKKGLDAPDGATHFELIASAAALDFDKVMSDTGTATSGVLKVGAGKVGPLELSCTVPAGSELPLVLGLGVVFYQEVNGDMNVLRGGGAFEIVGVDS